MNTFLGIIVGIIGLGFLILVHEFGHFIVAKAAGMRVEEFSLGFGRFLVSRRWGETVYGISAVPLGGYVRVTGMHKEEYEQRIADLRAQESGEGRDPQKRRPQDPEDRLAGKRALSAEEIASTPEKRRYYTHPFWHKLLFIVAGVAMNVIIAYLLLYAVGVTQGENWRGTVIAEVAEGSAAEAAGIQPGDRIVRFAGVEVDTWDELTMEIIANKGETVEIVVERGGALEGLQTELGVNEQGTAYLGVSSTTDIEHKDIGLGKGFSYAGRETLDAVVVIFRGIGWMFSGDVPVTGSQGLAGPVGIVQISADALAGGWASYAWFLALISINLALLNMLPLLPLDGGHVVLSIVERIRGRSISLRVFERVSMVGLALFVMLFFVAMYNDVGRIFTGW
ncbi:MAG: site-2 protease family protein [Thermoleophilia bacterium]|nr:site-2 protease family protein [Thermoleophilia bacterium]